MTCYLPFAFSNELVQTLLSFLVNNLLSKDDTKYNAWPDVPPFHRVERNVSHFYAMKDRYKLHSLQEKHWLCELLQDEIR